MKFKVTRNVAIDEHTSIEDVNRCIASNNMEGLNERIQLFNIDMSKYGYTTIGQADIVLTFKDPEEINANILACIDAQITTIRAESQGKINQLEEARSKLLALPNHTIDAPF